MTSNSLATGRRAFERHAWSEAYALLSGACAPATADPDDLECLAMAAYLSGRDAESIEAWNRAHQEQLARGNVERAVRDAFWLGFVLIDRGEAAQASGWLARARRLLDDGRCDCVEQGYVLFPTALQKALAGDFPGAYETFVRVAEIGERFGDRDLTALARHGQGRTLIHMGEFRRGLPLLDEVMVAVTAGEVVPLFTGIIYCSVISACHEIFDLRRAHEWTTALGQWVGSQPDLVPYRGQCLVRRAEILQFRGAWESAMDEARRACERLADLPGKAALGGAIYQVAELHRLRGELDQAEQLYRQASQYIRAVQPGLALLRLTQGDLAAANSSIRRALEETSGIRAKAVVLAAYVEIVLAAGDVTAARSAAEELAKVAQALDTPYPMALSAQATGAVLVAEGNPAAGLTALRQAWNAWNEMNAPYEAARLRVLMAQAYHALHDEDASRLELEAARIVFEQLGAGPDVTRIKTLFGKPATGRASGLTGREMEILRLVATGRTNRAIAQKVGISEKTVARHVANIFAKLNLSSRAAATAYAYEHRLIDRPA